MEAVWASLPRCAAASVVSAAMQVDARPCWPQTCPWNERRKGLTMPPPPKGLRYQRPPKSALSRPRAQLLQAAWPVLTWQVPVLQGPQNPATIRGGLLDESSMPEKRRKKEKAAFESKQNPSKATQRW